MKNYSLGIDVGTVAMSLALLDEDNTIIHTSYLFHQGQIKENLLKQLKEIDISSVSSIGYTSSTPDLLSKGIPVDPRIAYITASKFFHPDVQSLLIIGAEKFGLVTFDEFGEYTSYKSNSSCAAGTGNFLDQQSERLNLKSIKEFSRLAYNNTGSFPKIASRCAVFAKTDLIHAQQEGYSLEEICDGLSYGCAKNIVNTVIHDKKFTNIIAAGGVALNKAVIAHIGQMTEMDITVDEYAHIYGSIGAALNCSQEKLTLGIRINKIESLVITEKREKSYYYPPLQLKLSDYPDFDKHETYEYHSTLIPAIKAVEVDIYISERDFNTGKLFLGIDIGSTSTKAVLLNNQRVVLAGFYTRTSGQPIHAVQVILEAIADFSAMRNIDFDIAGVGTTGSGRKFTGKIIGADVILDEITAHAIAAYELDPETDTIIEIGGQDSKFTVMVDGVVTFSIMNNVCAAGTGSFIEEQAKRMACSIKNYSQKVENVDSPMASDRCTVFMERDLNHYLTAGYSTEEILAAVLHSTRENYLTKVAIKGYIGRKIFFQGATAKNRALVAAFEQKLNKPIMVSQFCHLTGALGVALDLQEKQTGPSIFRGLDLYKKNIPIKSEVCELCTNHCKLKVAQVNGELEAYGFLCGRDYNTQKYVGNRNSGFPLLKKRKEIFKIKLKTELSEFTIGLPAGLHLHEELPFWQKFFDLLSIKTITSEDYLAAIKDGKGMSGAEFCSPIAAMHGHVEYLREKADYIFLPVYLAEASSTKMHNQYCYYTQYVSSVISVQKNFVGSDKLLTPTLKYSNGELFIRYELYRMLKSIGLKDLGFLSITNAYEKAKRHIHSADQKWKSLYHEKIKSLDDIHIMLLGRPYTVLSQAMNSNIPELIEKIGINAFYMDMLPTNNKEITKANELIKTIHWKFASKILYAAELAARTTNCYPVLITSFKCTPDSFVIEYFKEILDTHHKPYLVLQLDEHDSNVGYETRIEAAIRAFRNHRTSHKLILVESTNTITEEDVSTEGSGSVRQISKAFQKQVRLLMKEASVILKTHSIDFSRFSRLLQQSDIEETPPDKSILKGTNNLKNRTLLLPSWDPIVCPLLEAVLKNSGIDARVIDNSLESTQRSMSFNTGQCLPLNIIVQNAIDYIETNNLDPASTLLWIMKSNLSCNLSMFPYYMKKLLDTYGKGMEQASVYIGDVVFYDISLATAINAYLAYMIGGYIRKIGCTIRPYEKEKGATDIITQKILSNLYIAFLEGKPTEEIIERSISELESIEIIKTDRPKVAIFGDLYVRDNDLMNQELIKTVEAYGGEVITTPYTEYIKIISQPLKERNFKEGRYLNYLKIRFLKSLVPLVEEKYQKYFTRYNGEADNVTSGDIDNWLNKFGLNVMQGGESFENILKVYKLMREHPDLDLFIQTNPSYCCPSLVTEAMTSRIEELTGVPVVTIEYDGTSGIKNQDIIPYLKYRKKKKTSHSY